MADFSYDGQYLATGGADSVLKIWKVSDENEGTHELFYKEPYWEFEEHHLDIIAIAWN